MTTGNKPFLLTVFGLVLSTGVYAQYAPYPDRGQQPESQSATGPYDKTAVQAQLRLNIAQDVEKVHFIRNNNDPNVVTKAYVLKHADPYEIRPFVRNAVSSRRVETSPTTVECIKYSDGTGVLLVSAEDYRFTDQSRPGMSIDEIVAMLDKPRLTSSSGSLTYLYFPKYFSAEALCGILAKVGANVEGDNVELQYGRDSLSFDTGLNAMLMYVPRYSAKHLERLLKIYDIPSYDVDVRYRLYEVDAENDSKIGLDFQAWKNNGGANLFSVGARFRDGWSANWAGGPNRTGTSNTRFLNFNPKWNTRYLDFLVSKSKAKIAASGEVRARNNQETVISRDTGLFVIDAQENEGSATTISSGYVKDPSQLSITNKNGYKVTASGPFSVIRIQTPSTKTYDLQGVNGTVFTVEGDGGSCKTVEGARIKDDSSITFYTNVPADSGRGPTINSVVANGFSFRLSITPSITAKATTLQIGVAATSLLGYASSGAPRLNSTVSENEIMIGNERTNRFVIGGINKTEIVRSSTGVPLLKDLPLIGWLFSTEGESTKQTRLVIVAECELISPATTIPENMQADIISVKDAVEKRQDSSFNSYGYRQFGLDPER